MSKFRFPAMAGGLALTAAFATSAFAITNEAECASEGGSMVNVKNSDYCLVPIRDKAYHDEIYDGNQLGVKECPGDKLNDDTYCLYPVTIRPAPVAAATPEEALEMAGETVLEPGTVVDDAVNN